MVCDGGGVLFELQLFYTVLWIDLILSASADSDKREIYTSSNKNLGPKSEWTKWMNTQSGKTGEKCAKTREKSHQQASMASVCESEINNDWIWSQ